MQKQSSYALKRALFAVGLASAVMAANAADYYVVMPRGKSAQASQPGDQYITVALNNYTLPAGTVGLPYAGFNLNNLVVVNGDPAFNSSQVTWRVSGGAIPSGLSLSASGVISGTPTVAGTGSFTVEATYRTKTGTRTYQLVVADLTVGLNAATLPTGNVGNPYYYDFKTVLALAGDPARDANLASFALGAGSSMPPGLSLAANGVVSGTPTTQNATGTDFEVVATYKTKSGQRVYTIVVNGAVLTVKQISLGDSYSCALTTAGGVKCWGLNNFGQLGDGTFSNRTTPVQVSGLTSGVASISASRGHTCALTTGGGVKCWGSNSYGRLGDGTTATRNTPTDVPGLTSGVASVTAGNYHTCAITTGGSAKCWGFNANGQLGDGTTTDRLTPTQVSGLTSGVKSIGPGGEHTCAALNSGSVKCWGSNGHGQLGDGTLVNKSLPVDVSGLNNANYIVGGWGHTCALTSAGGAKCWGYNGYGQVGDGTFTSRSTPVTPIGFETGAVSISATYTHTCGSTTSGAARCWGYNFYGQLGNGTKNNTNVPYDVFLLSTGVNSVATGGGHSCALLTTGSVKCWGFNSSGQLGNGSTSDIISPVDVKP